MAPRKARNEVKEINPENCSSAEEFAEAVGRAIIAFQSVESRAANLFAWLLGAGVGASAVFYHIGNFTTRIQMMDIAARWMLIGDERLGMMEDWKKLRTRLYEVNDLRNRIAHSEIRESYSFEEEEFAFTLHQPFMDWSRLDPLDPEKWAKAQKARDVDFVAVKGAEATFEALERDLEELQNRLSKDHVRVEREVRDKDESNDDGKIEF